MFRSLMGLVILLVVGFWVRVPSYASIYPSLPPAVVRVSERIGSAKSLEERVTLFKELRRLVHSKAQGIPAELTEADLPVAQSLFELDLLLEEVDVEKISTDQCGRYPARLRSLADPQALNDDQLGAAAYFAIQVVKSVCRIK